MTAAPDAARDEHLETFAHLIAEEAYFEAHEVLEAFWVNYRGPDRDFFRGLIQAAVALHHAGRGNAVGAHGVAARARANLAPFAPRHAGIDVDAFVARLASL